MHPTTFSQKWRLLSFTVVITAFLPLSMMAWNGNAINDVAGQSNLYLYNVGSGTYLNASGAWGAQPALSEVGMPLTLTKTGNAYFIQGSIKNVYFGDYLTLLDNGCWFDQSQQESSKWTFTPISSSSRVYTLRATFNGTSYYLKWDGSSPLLSWNSESLTSVQNNPNAQWMIVSRADLLAAMEEATSARPCEVTFYIKDPGFTYNDKNQSAWVPTDASKNWFIGINGNNDNAGDDAQYYNAEIWQDANGLNQTLSGLKKGTYLLTVQALYRNGTISAAEASRQNGSEQIHAYLFAGTASTPLQSIFDDAGKYGGNLGVNTAFGYIPDTRTQSGQYFYKGLYGNNCVAVYVATDNSSLNIGVRKEAGTADWLAFDNFRLMYFGEEDVSEELNGLYEGYNYFHPEEFVLDEDATTFDNLTGYSHARLVMRRSLDLGKWNSIILPVDIDYYQFVNTFGADTRMARLVGIDETNHDKVVFQRLKLQPHKLAVQKGTHYLIYPTLPPNIAKGEQFALKDGTSLTGPIYLIDNVMMERGQFIVDSLYTTHDYSVGLYMMGTYYKRDGSTMYNEKIPAGSYAFAQGDLYHIVTPQTLKGFRCWMEDMEQDHATKSLSISVVDELPTDIHEGCRIDEKQIDTTLYDLQGRIVGKDSSDKTQLKPGIYIINRQKILIR